MGSASCMTRICLIFRDVSEQGFSGGGIWFEDPASLSLFTVVLFFRCTLKYGFMIERANKRTVVELTIELDQMGVKGHTEHALSCPSYGAVVVGS